jgi:outer membrane receptor protein involved in Fe transport
MKKGIIFFLLVFGHLMVLAQNDLEKKDGAISGRVVDIVSNNPIEYATITIYAYSNTKPVNGTVTNAKGSFQLAGLAQGSYRITIESIGYNTISKDSVLITAEQPSVSVGEIALSSHSSTLQTVTVTASHPLIENKIDKIVYNVEKDITSQGGVATDVLKKVPQVFVDVDGNVELQGSSSIRFLINGKPSTMFGSSVADALQSIPASQIQSIEVVTSPGAKYDAQGTGGIINIILKKSNVRGINGTVNLSVGTRLENGSFNLNYRHDNFGINAYFGGNAQLKSRTLSHLNRTSEDDQQGITNNLIQNGHSDLKRRGYYTGIGFDWSPSKKDNITGTLSYHNFGYNDVGLTYQDAIETDQSGNQISDTNIIRNTSNDFKYHSVDWSLNYRKTFTKEKQELDISFDNSDGHNLSSYTLSQNYFSESFPFMGSSSDNPGLGRERAASIDYIQPVNDQMTIETGAKYIRDIYNSTANVYALEGSSNSYIFDPQQSYVLDYKRDIYAYYLSTSFSLFHFLDVKAGGRYEYTSSKIDLSSDHNISVPSYSILAPSLTLSRQLTENQSVKVSYTHRIERPDYGDLNPFLNFSDPHNISTGNPLLRPEKGNNYELGYNHSFEKESNLNISLIYRRNTDDISSYTNFYPDFIIGDSVYHNVSLTSRQNFNSDERIGFNLSGSLSVSDKFTLRTNIFAFNHIIHTTLYGGSANSGYGYRMNINGTYLVNKDLAFEFFGNFRSKDVTAQGSQTSFISYNLAMRKYFFNKKFSLGLTTTNPFNTYINQTRETKGMNFQQVSVRQIPFRSFGINLMYKFGKLEFKKPKENDLNNQDTPFQGN